jgi:hypothetical protein
MPFTFLMEQKGRCGIRDGRCAWTRRSSRLCARARTGATPGLTRQLFEATSLYTTLATPIRWRSGARGGLPAVCMGFGLAGLSSASRCFTRSRVHLRLRSYVWRHASGKEALGYLILNGSPRISRNSAPFQFHAKNTCPFSRSRFGSHRVARSEFFVLIALAPDSIPSSHWSKR